MKRKKKNMYKKSVNVGSKFKWHRFLVKGIAGILIILGLMGGGYVFWRHHTGKISDGLYQLQTAKYYNSTTKTWMDGKPGYEGTKLKDFMRVEDQEAKEYTYYTFESSYGSFDNVSPIDFETGKNYKVSAWSRTFKPLVTPKDYQREVHSIVQKYYKASALVSQKDIDQMEKKLIDLYKRRSEGKISYEAKGNQLTVIIFDKKGKAIEKRSYKHLSGKDAKQLDANYQKAVKRYKKSNK